MVRVQKKLTENFPQRRNSTRTAEKRKLVKPVKDLDQSLNSTAYEDEVLPKIDEGSLESFRKALDTSSPEDLPGREAQIREIREFLTTHLAEKSPGSMYISGAPGTGKTAVVNLVLEGILREGKKAGPGFFQVFINCMCKQSAKEIYEVIHDKLKITTTKAGQKYGSVKDKVEQRIFTKSKAANMIVIILDEMDQILKGSNEVLYSLFEWARTPGSKLILIGIANALDLTVRHLPFLHLNSSPVKQAKGADGQPMLPAQSTCKTMSFPPYQREDIEKIIQQRMEQVGQNILHPTAIKFVAAKVAASTGDARKALHACKEAMVTVEKQEQQRSVLQAASDNVMNSSLVTPTKVCIRNDQIGIAAVSKVLQIKKDDGPLPLQQTTILAALLKINRDAPNTRDPMIDGVNKSVPMPTLYKQYRKICSLKGFTWIEESELPLICEVLQDRSLVSVVSTGNSTGKKLSVGSRKFGSPSVASSGSSRIGVQFDPRSVESLVFQGDMQGIF